MTFGYSSGTWLFITISLRLQSPLRALVICSSICASACGRLDAGSCGNVRGEDTGRCPAPLAQPGEQIIGFGRGKRARIEHEHENLRSALSIALSAQDASSSWSVAASLWFFWFWRGYWREGVEWVKRLLSLPAPNPRLRGRVLVGASNLAGRSGDYARFQAWLSSGRDTGADRAEADTSRIDRCSGSWTAHELERSCPLCPQPLSTIQPRTRRADRALP